MLVCHERDARDACARYQTPWSLHKIFDRASAFAYSLDDDDDGNGEDGGIREEDDASPAPMSRYP